MLVKIITADVALRQSLCKHDGMYWYPAPHDEQGWRCVDCDLRPGEEPGYSPEHDRDLLRTKVGCVLHDLADANIVSVSNSSHGEGVTDAATARCREWRRFDQESIAMVLLLILAGDGAYWREMHEKILGGDDPRKRCHCGKLAHIYCGGEAYCCFEHRPQREDGPF